MIEAGKIVPLMDLRRFDLDEVAAAHEEVGHGRAGGRVVVDVYKPA